MADPQLPTLENLRPLIEAPVTFLILSTVFGTLCAAVLVALFFFSTRSLRRSWVFVLNVLSLLFGIGHAIYTVRTEVFMMYAPLTPESTSAFITFTLLIYIGPIFVDAILLLRMLAVYPYARTPRVKWFALLFFPVACKIIRLVTVLVSVPHIQIVLGPQVSLVGIQEMATWMYTKLIRAAELADNFYMSAFFLWRMWKHRQQTAVIASNSSTFPRRLRKLTWIAISNFVIPVLLNGACLLAAYGLGSFNAAAQLAYVSFYAAILGVVFATVWASGTRWTDERAAIAGAGVPLTLSSLRFAGGALANTSLATTEEEKTGAGESASTLAVPRPRRFSLAALPSAESKSAV